jgi:C4-dicarboxylate-specific signal transduction histidine kinase
MNALSEMQELVSEQASSVGDESVTPEDHRQIIEELRECLSLAERGAERSIAFLRGIKAHTRDRKGAPREPFDAAISVRESLDLLAHAARAGRCNLVFEPKGSFIVLGSSERLAQVVTNLVSNAIDATADRGGGAIEVSLCKAAGEIELRVSDGGGGIDPDVLPRIFEPLFTTKPPGKGTGLGLSIVAEIVNGEFAGRVAVKSSDSSGTTFTAHLPAHQEG